MAIGDLQLPLYPWGSLAPMLPQLAKAQSNVTASNIPGAKIPGPYDFLNAMTSLSNVQGENALRQQQIALSNMQQQNLAFQLQQAMQWTPEKALAFIKTQGGQGQASTSPAAGQAAEAPAVSGRDLGDGLSGGGAIPGRIAQTAAANNVDPRLALATADIESSMGSNLGNRGNIFQLGSNEWDSVGGGKMGEPETDIKNGVAFLKTKQDELTSALGREPTPSEIYLAHQQGTAGAAKLIGNPDKTPAELGLGPAVASNRGDPNAPAAAFVGKIDSLVQSRLAKYAPPDTVDGASSAPAQPAQMAQNGPMSSVPSIRVPQLSPAQGAPTAPQTPTQMPGSLSGGIDPERLGALGFSFAMTGRPDAAKPLENMYYNSPAFLQQKAQAEAAGGAAGKLPFAGPTAAAEALGKNPILIAQAVAQMYPPGSPQRAMADAYIQKESGIKSFMGGERPGQPLLQYVPGQGYRTVDVPGLAGATQELATARAAGPAAFKFEDSNGPYGQNFRQTALGLATQLGGGQGAASVAPAAPGGDNLAVGGAMPAPARQAVPGALPAVQPAQRPYAAPPNFPVPMAGNKDLDQLSVNDMFAAGLKPTEPPKPPPGATYGPASAGLTELQKRDADRVEGYGKEAAENEKAYQDLGHLGDILDRGMKTNKLAPLWAEINNIGQGLGLKINTPVNAEDQAAFDKAATDLIFAAVKKMGGKVLVSEIEGFRQANPSSVLPIAANRSIISDVLSAGKWQDARARLAQQYLTQTGGAPLADFESQFKRMAPLDSVSEHYRSLFRDQGWKFPEDVAKDNAAPAREYAKGPNGHMIYRENGKLFDAQTGMPFVPGR